MKKTVLSLFLAFVSIMVMVMSGVVRAAIFPDVIDHVYRESIRYVKEKGIVSGYNDGTYKPDNTINRAELTKIIIEAKYPNLAKGNNCFTDVKNEWFAPYVCFAKEKGVIGGYPDGSFKPSKEVNWVEALKITLEALEVDLRSNSGEWYQKYINFAKNADIVPSDIVDNHSILKRGQMAYLIHKIYELNELLKLAQSELEKHDEMILKKGPCLGVIKDGWVADVAHYPRNNDDKNRTNQCNEWHQKKVGSFIEIEPDGTFIRIGHQDI